MRIRTVRVTNFRSIIDSGDVAVGDVTCLVGKNESGKTNFLQALVRQNPAPGQPRGFDLDDDYPRRQLGSVAEKLKDAALDRPVAVAVTYEMSEAEWDSLVDEFGPGTIKLPEERVITISRAYDGKRWFAFSDDEGSAARALIKRFGVEGDAARTTTLAGLRTAAEGVQDGPLAKVRTRLDRWDENGDLSHAIIARISHFEPLYLYFDEYASLPGEGNVRELLEKRESNGDLSSAQRTFLALVDEARVDLDVLTDQEFKVIRNRLESASINISEELYRFWSQNQTSRIDFDHTYETRPDHPPNRTDLVLKLLVEDTRYGSVCQWTSGLMASCGSSRSSSTSRRSERTRRTGSSSCSSTSRGRRFTGSPSATS